MDALSAIIALLRPQAAAAKLIHGAGRWGVSYSRFGHPSYALVLRGPCWLKAEGVSARKLHSGDFILFPATPRFTLASDLKVKPKPMEPAQSGDRAEEVFHGDSALEPSVSLLGGHFTFDPANAPALTALLPAMLHFRADHPSAALLRPVAELLRREALGNQEGRAFVLNRLLEIMLVETLRTAPPEPASAGLLAGLRDSRLAPALRAMHTRTAHPWTLASLAREASMSRSSFADHFARVVGAPPLRHLLRWRMAVARDLLGRGQMTVEQTALAVGYESASGFSIACRRETGRPPRAHMARRKEAPAAV